MPKVISYEEVAKENSRDSCYMVIHNNVYDVTKFLIEHPGGEEVMLDYAGKDATEAFEDVGHSEDAREQMSDFLVGALPEEEKGTQTKSKVAPKVPSARSTQQSGGESSWFIYFALVAAVAGAGIAYIYMK